MENKLTTYKVRLLNRELAKEGKKHCSKCQQNLELPYFRKNKRHIDGLTNHCRSCINENYRRWHKTNEKVRIKAKKNYHENKSKYRNWELKRLFNITLNDYNIMLEQQNNVCKICKQPEPSKKRVLSVDHCHKTGKIRGLLCSNCNLGIGNFHDSTELLKRTIIYLEDAKNEKL